MPGRAAVSSSPVGPEIAPFRAVHFDPERVDLGAVLCPPYDVVEPGEDELLRHRSPYNAVHVVRPRIPAESAGWTRYEHAAELLAEWRGSGILRMDAVPALYVYEQHIDGTQQIGVLGAVRLQPDADGAVLPHEDVFPGPVEDRLALMRATNAQLEPILLASTAPSGLGELLRRATVGPPWLEGAPPDGTLHRVWRLAAPADIAAVQAAVGASPALIADGHHRYASYQRLQQERQAQHRTGGASDFGVALIVDPVRGGLTLSAIHRTVRGTTLDRAVSRLNGLATTRRLGVGSGGDCAGLLRLLAGDSDARATQSSLGSFVAPRADIGPDRSVRLVVTDGRDSVLVEWPIVGTDRRAALAATVAAERLLPTAFDLTDGDDRVRYHHEAAEAVTDAVRQHGVAIVLPPPHLADVVALAGVGEKMPRKSTSFGPKPRSGAVMRLL